MCLYTLICDCEIASLCVYQQSVVENLILYCLVCVRVFSVYTRFVESSRLQLTLFYVIKFRKFSADFVYTLICARSPCYVV